MVKCWKLLLITLTIADSQTQLDELFNRSQAIVNSIYMHAVYKLPFDDMYLCPIFQAKAHKCLSFIWERINVDVFHVKSKNREKKESLN